MKNNKKYKVNKGLYVVLFLVSIVIICISMVFPINSKLFVVLSGIGCGCLASVLVALLVEYFHCEMMNKKDKQVLDFSLEELFSAIADYCDCFSNFVVSIDKKYQTEKHNFYEWVQIYAQLVANGNPQVRKTYITGAMDSVKDAFDAFYSSRVWYLENNIFTKEEIHAIKELCESIYISKLFFMISDVEVTYQKILEFNYYISENILKVKYFAKIANTKYSDEQNLCNMFVDCEYE